jgi:MFS family permease
MTTPAGQENIALLLKSSSFRGLWLGDLSARLGYQISQFLLPLLALTILHESAIRVGLVTATQFLPVVILSLVAGVWATRLTPRFVMVSGTLLRAFALAALGIVAVITGLAFWLVLLAAAVIGSATVFYDIAYQAAAPRLIPARQLLTANGILQSSNSIALMAGPAIAGFSVQSLGMPVTVTVTVMLFLCAAAGFTALGRTAVPAGARKDVLATVVAGLKFTWRCRPIRDVCLQSGIFNLHEQAFLTSFLLFGVNTLHLGGGLVGTIVGMGSLGALLGSLAMGYLSTRLHTGATITGALSIASVAFLLIPAASRSVAPVVLMGLCFACNGVAVAAYNVLVISLRQLIPPEHLLGPVTASYRLASFGTIPLGGLLGGWLTGLLGGGTALWVIAGSLVLSSLAIFSSPLRRVRDVAQATLIGCPDSG